MNSKQIAISLLLIFAVFLVACSPEGSTDIVPENDMESEQIMEKEDDSMTDDSEMTEKDDDSMMDDKDEAMSEHEDVDLMKDDDKMDDMDKDDSEMSEVEMMSPEWFSIPLINVQTDEIFSVADLKGKVVLVETLAMWCSNCLKQQGQVLELHNLLGEQTDFVSLGIDIDPNENADALKNYVDKNGFGWWYTVAPTELAREIGRLYGDQFLNPPSTPMLIIDSHGEVHPLPFGIKSAEDLLEAVQPFLDGEM